MKRFNTIAIFLIIIAVGLNIVYRNYNYGLSPYEGSQHSRSEKKIFGYASEGEMPYTGQDVKVPGGTFVRYMLEDDNNDIYDDVVSNITIVDLKDGRSHKILSKDDSRMIHSWQMIFRPGDEEQREAVGYIAWLANETDYAAGRADLVVGSFPEFQQHVLAKKIKYADLPKVYGNNGIAAILWDEEDSAYFVAIDLESGSILQKKNIDLPLITKSLISQGPGKATHKIPSRPND